MRPRVDRVRIQDLYAVKRLPDEAPGSGLEPVVLYSAVCELIYILVTGRRVLVVRVVVVPCGHEVLIK
jgi:hypothetical protein